MKILLIDATACFVDFALRAEAQGHDVRVFMSADKDGERCTVGDGLLHKVDSWQGSLKWADLILTSDNCKYIRELEGARARGLPLFGPNAECTSWELNRSAGQRVLEEAGIECLPSIPFTNYDDALTYQLANRGKRYVSKPSADVDKSLSYVSKSFKDMCFMLETWKRRGKAVPFIFQEFCPGLEMAVGGWMGRDGFAEYFLENFEFKKLMPGEVGVNTGEMGTAMKYVRAEQSKLAREMLLPLEARLIREGYTGYIDVAVMIGTEGARKGKPNPMEFTSRPGWPCFNIQQILHPDVAGWMRALLDGADTFQPSQDVALGVVIAIPDFPYNKLKRKELTGYPIWGVTPQNRYNFHPSEVKLGYSYGDDNSGLKHPLMVSAGNYIGVVSGTGKTVSRAKRNAYVTLKELQLPNSPIYRIDIGSRLEEQLPELQRYGYAEAWEY